MPVATTPDRITQRDGYLKLWNTLAVERSSFDAHWQEIATFLFPVRPRFSTSERNRGTRRTQSIIDSTASFALQILRSGLHSGLTSPARPWFQLSVPDPGLAKFGPVKVWLHDVSERMRAVFQLSNLYNALPLMYGDMAAFGTAAMAVLDDPGTAGRSGDLFRCYPYPIGSYVLGLDNAGRATIFGRKYVKTVAQLVEEFGGPEGHPLEPGDPIDWSRFSQTVKNAWDASNREQPIEVTWLVKPNYGHDPNRFGARGFPWISCHFETGTETSTVLRESGFHEFPILAPRWFANAEDTYGTDCPGMMALGDIKQLQSMQKRKGVAIEKMVNPPVQGPTHLRTQKVSLIPGDVNYVDVQQAQQGIRPVHEVKPDLSHFVLDQQDVRERIDQAFYKPLFLMLAYGSRGAQPPTAREVEERHEEKLTALGPVLESTIDELLDPLIDRVFPMMDRAGLIPPAPPDLEGIELTVEYVSILAQAQKLGQLNLLDRFMQTWITVGQVAPEAVATVKPREVLREYQDGLGINPTLLRTDDDIDAMLAQQQQANKQMLMAEQLSKTAGAAKALGTTPVGRGDTALDQVLEAVGG